VEPWLHDPAIGAAVIEELNDGHRTPGIPENGHRDEHRQLLKLQDQPHPGRMSRVLALPDETRLFTGHDYQPGGRLPAWESTVAQQKAENVHVKGQDEASFVKLRMDRDRTLPMPKLMLSALQVNIAGGRLPAPEKNGRRYLKIPLDVLDNPAWD
jgi:hypothetical protein